MIELPNRSFEEAEVIGEVFVGARDRLTGFQVLRFKVRAVRGENVAGLVLGGRRARF